MRQSLDGKDRIAPMHKTNACTDIAARRERRRCLSGLAHVIALRFDDEGNALRQPVFDIGAELELFIRADGQQFSGSVEGAGRVGEARGGDDLAFAGRLQKGASDCRRSKYRKPKRKQKRNARNPSNTHDKTLFPARTRPTCLT
jgi:hypothetical protein